MVRSLWWIAVLLLTGCAATQNSFCSLIEPDSYFLVSLARCETVDVSFDYDREAGFAALQGYDWLEAQSVSYQDAVAPGAGELHQWVVASVDGKLAQQGFERDRGMPDFLVDYDAVVESDATLTLTVLRPADREVIWRGTAVDQGYPARDSQAQQQRIRAAVGLLLEQFPPGEAE
jgi:hypothetical protein